MKQAIFLAGLLAAMATSAMAQTPAAQTPAAQPQAAPAPVRCINDTNIRRFPENTDSIRGLGVTWADNPGMGLPVGDSAYAGLIERFPFTAVGRQCQDFSVVVTLWVPNDVNDRAQALFQQLLTAFNLPNPAPTLNPEQWKTLTERGTVSLGDEFVIEDYRYDVGQGMAVLTYTYWVDD